jgi:Carboxypeptidase regulatory-like domain
MRLALFCAIFLGVGKFANAKDCCTSKQFVVRHAQKLSGVFLDPDNQVLPGIRVQLLSGKRIVQDLRTNNQGEYDLGEVAAGAYQISIQYSHHALCAPEVRCSSKGCQILPKLRINPKDTVVVR